MTALVQWVWQGTALAGAVAIALRCAPRVNASTRYAVWWLTLAAALALPAVGALARPIASLLAPTGRPTGDATTPVASVGALTDLGGPWLALQVVPDWLIACGIGFWLGTVVLGCGRLVAGVRTVRRLKRLARPLPASVAVGLHATAGRVRGAELRCSSAIDGACALGLLGRPVVVVSHRLVSALEPHALDLIVLHELMHLRRYDDWWRALQACVLVVAGVHPAIRFISNRIDAERELACDEAVAAQTGEPQRYAASLAAVADLLAGTRTAPGGHALVPNAVGTGSLLARVQRLLDPRACRQASLQAGTLVASAAILAGAMVGFGRVRPIVAITPLDAASPLGATTPAQPLDGRPIRGRFVRVTPAPAVLAPDPVAARTSRRGPRTTTVRTRVREDAAPGVAEIRATVPSIGPADRAADQTSADVEGDLQPLSATPLPAASTAVVAIRGNDVRNREGSGDNGWASTGASARRAGAAIGNYFSRAGRAVASHF